MRTRKFTGEADVFRHMHRDGREFDAVVSCKEIEIESRKFMLAKVERFHFS
jgi:hypothetical protein